MAAIGGTYDPDAKPSAGYTPMPAGDYTLEIVESDYTANSKGNGMLLKLKAQVVGGEFDGRSYFINLSLEHENGQTQEIAQRDFAALRRAVGVLDPQDTEELHFKAFPVKLGVKKRKDTGEMENTIKEYVFDKLADTPPANDNPRQPAAAAAARPAAASAGKSRPWDKK
jgi:hypothetical protein